MPAEQPQGAAAGQREPAPAESAWAALRERLESENDRIYEQIKHYPRPIPACDLQFNSLLEERDAIVRELDQLDAAAAASLQCPDPMKVLDAFVRSSKYLKEGSGR